MGEQFCLQAVPYAFLPMNRKVFSANVEEYYLPVSVPAEFYESNKLYQVDEVNTTSRDAHLLEFDFIKYEDGHPWFDFVFAALNQEPGYHTYRMRFVNPVTNLTTSLYFGYIIQTNAPKKPYIYMDRGRDCDV